jgi:hypothetical protein
MTTPANLNALKLTGTNPLITGHVYINPTSENLTIASASENITLDSQNVSFWTDEGKTTALTFNGLVGNLATEVTDRTTAVASAQVAAEATAQTALDATTVSITASLTSLDNNITGVSDLAEANLAAETALRTSADTIHTDAIAGLDTRLTTVEAIETRIAALESLIAAINSAP